MSFLSHLTAPKLVGAKSSGVVLLFPQWLGSALFFFVLNLWMNGQNNDISFKMHGFHPGDLTLCSFRPVPTMFLHDNNVSSIS